MIYGFRQLVVLILVGSFTTVGHAQGSQGCGRTLEGIPGPFTFQTRYVDPSRTQWNAGGSGTISIKSLSGDEQVVKLGTDIDFNSIFVSDGQYAYAVGLSNTSSKKEGKVYASKDGGQTWTEQKGNISAELNGITCVDHSACWIVGNNGIVLRTTNAGDKWDVSQINTSEAILAVDFISPTTGWIAGKEGLIMKTVDGGVTWIKVKAAMFSTNNESEKHAIVWKGISFRSASLGCIAGYGRITCTSDGGQSWSRTIYSDKEGIYNFVNFAFYEDKIRVLEECGRDFESFDLGKSWQPVKSRQMISRHEPIF